MNRLTQKDKDHIGGYTPNGTYDIGWKANAFEKLGKYEDIDEKLGLPYPVLIKMLKNGNIYVKKKNNEIINICEYSLDCNGLDYWFLDIGKGYYNIVGLKDYGKTWALTREELE